MATILNKPDDLTDAERMLRLLRGRQHRVHTGVAILAPDHAPVTEVMTSAVTMHPFSDVELAPTSRPGNRSTRRAPMGSRARPGTSSNR